LSILCQYGFTPLMNAAYYDHMPVVQLLLENGADTSYVNMVRLSARAVQ